jgi:hypothetical protein
MLYVELCFNAGSAVGLRVSWKAYISEQATAGQATLNTERFHMICWLIFYENERYLRATV